MKIRFYSAIITTLFLTGCETSTGNSAPALSTGTYAHQETQVWTQSQQGINATVLLKSQLVLNSDNTYLVQGYATSTSPNWTDYLVAEEKGSYSLDGRTLTKANRLARSVNFTTNQMSAWAVPGSGSTGTSYIQNITSTTFQDSNSVSGHWVTWSKI